jgi:asparagine synthase (glutamine-hydrolysing)
MSWRAVLGLATRPLLPVRARGILNGVRGIKAMQVEDATGLRPEFARSLGVSPQGALETAEMRDGRALRVWSLSRNDFGGHIAALQRLTGVQQTDPTSDRRVMDFCLSVPEEQFFAGGRRRSLIKDAMAGSLPPKVLDERRVGRQSADLLVNLGRERAEIGAEVKRLRTSELAARCLNLTMLEGLVENWPEPPHARADYTRYGMQLMRAVSMGRFIRRVEEGSLFAARADSVR